PLAGDLSWAGDDVARQADALAALAQAVSGAPLALLSRDATPDVLMGAGPEVVLDVLLGRDEATMRRYPAGERPARTGVRLRDGSDVPVLVGASDQFAARLAKVARERARWARSEDVSCYRVYDADLPDYAVSIDVYEALARGRHPSETWLYISEYAAPKGVDSSLARRRLMDVLAIAPRVMGVDPAHVTCRTRTRARGGSQYAGDADERRRVVRTIDEGGLDFEVDLGGHLDTGIFLDHRETRSMVREMAKRMPAGGRFLNLFAYTGTATCYAADGGAEHTTTVDLSRPYLDWAGRNLERNGFAGDHRLVQADVLAWVDEQRHARGAARYDLIFCDPPTFSNSSRMRKSSFDVQRDHVELLIGVSRLLAREGTCVFSCNLRGFKPDVEALAHANVTIEDVTAQTIPHDFARNAKVHHCYLVRRA
ncbi:MAG: class I SAM-dependent methyltransferase, partial [Atopobiaceae bacterium]|nr:class I SAM-dependent methyltransferase [Atopobiaceae bacterium]